MAISFETIQPYLTAPAVAAALAAVLAGTVFWNILTNILTSPIPSSVPGPLLARLTYKWLIAVDTSGYRGRTVHELHKKYGPVVRLSPSEVSFSSKDAVKSIYSASATVIKGPAYDHFGRKGMFQMKDPQEHRERYRRVAHIFSASSLQQMEPLVQAVMDRTVAAFVQRAGQAVDALHWCRMMALDVAGEVLMGKAFGAFEGEGGKAPVYVDHLDNAYIVWNLWSIAPLLCWVLELLPIKGIREFFAGGDYVYKYGADAVHDYIAREGRASSRRNLLTKLIAGNDENGTEPLSDEDIITEVSNLTFAAVDTTGNTATYALYRLACHPEWQQKLQREIRASGAADKGFAYKAVQGLPILNAVYTETLRLHPAAPSALPRQTVAPITEIAGLQLPAKTLVSMQATTTQRDPAYFPKPEQFDPSRWLTADGQIYQGTPDMQEMMIVWGGKGPRVCMGQYMATMEIKLLLARLMAQFTVRLQSEATHDEMVMTDHFTLIPKGKRCGLVFTVE
ncbi:cytochrome P450 [Echria macrotheca]|uniref:Cytochrome P450 n=1 Tax=Echria macrotheca TaxID=438768 RepID=A0AAJ0FE81_9PEZI|nr:cytochrome P450 [Echria macrotheca]